MKHWKRLVGLAAASASVVIGLNNCGGDDSTAPAQDAGTDMSVDVSPDTPMGPGTVQGNAIYQGAAKGVIYLGLFSSLPPSLTNVIGVTSITMPMLPGTSPYTISMVPPGTYFLYGEIAPAVQGPPPPPGPTTPVSMPLMVTVTAGQITKQDVQISDPPPQDGGTDSGSTDAGTDGANGADGGDGAGGDANDAALE